MVTAGGSWTYIPTWDGKHATFEAYQEEVLLVFSGTQDDHKKHLGPKLIGALPLNSDHRKFAMRLSRRPDDQSGEHTGLPYDAEDEEEPEEPDEPDDPEGVDPPASDLSASRASEEASPPPLPALFDEPLGFEPPASDSRALFAASFMESPPVLACLAVAGAAAGLLLSIVSRAVLARVAVLSSVRICEEV